MSKITDLDVLEQSLIACSGVWVQKTNKKTWILHGNLPQIELAHDYLRKAVLRHTDESDENSIPMTAEEFTRFSALFRPQGKDSGGNFHYDKNCLHVSGSKSFVDKIENQTKNIVTKTIDIAEDIYGLMKADITSLMTKLPVFVNEVNDRKLEVSGMSQEGVNSAVRILEEKRDQIDKQKKRKVSSQENHVFYTKEGLTIEVFRGNIRNMVMKGLIEFTTEACLQTSKGTSKQITEGNCLCWKTEGNMPYEFIVYACVPVLPSTFESQTEEALKVLITKVLKLADERKITSVGIPFWAGMNLKCLNQRTILHFSFIALHLTWVTVQAYWSFNHARFVYIISTYCSKGLFHENASTL